jgi:hypothetical protein
VATWRALDSPLYGMFDARRQFADGARRRQLEEYFIRQPATPTRLRLKWDGEWQITYETFRDMGAAYAWA